jgi:hypothetical protein
MFGTRKLIAGVSAGLAGGVVFGMMMAQMGMLPMIGKMVGQPTVAAGWLVHLGISAAIGGSFAVLLGWAVTGKPSSLVLGTVYGTAWWLIGPLTLMPLFMGMGLGANWNLAAAQNMLPSLMGHAIFGMVLGLGYAPLKTRLDRRSSTGDQPRRRAQAAA